MTPADQEILAIVARALHRFPWHPVLNATPETELRCDVDRATIAYAVEELIGRELPEPEWRAWLCAADVIASAARHAPAHPVSTPKEHQYG